MDEDILRLKVLEEISNTISNNRKWKQVLTTKRFHSVDSGDTNFFYDLVFYRDDKLLALFEFEFEGESMMSLLDYYVSSKNTATFFILFNGRTYEVYNRVTNEFVEVETVVQFLSIIMGTIDDEKIDSSKLKIADIISEEADKFFKDRSDVKKLLSHKNVRDHLIYSESGQFFHFSKDNRDLDNFENRFFQLLLEELKSGERIYRYTTLDTVFATINHQSLRMNGIVGMNDISEVGYVEDYIDGKSYLPFWEDGTAHQTISAINRRFILCASELEDDLNQWRLYGDDCQGACLAFSVKQGQKLPGMQIRKVSYGEKVDGKNYHNELEFLKVVIRRVKSELKQSLRFRTLDIWKHFFKSYEYASEAEVRLLVIVSPNDSIKGEQPDGENPHSLRTEWNLTASHKILNPYITIDIEDKALPIRLKEIWLGSKTPERYINKKQFEELLRSKNINYSGNHNVTVRLSGVSNYR